MGVGVTGALLQPAKTINSNASDLKECFIEPIIQKLQVIVHPTAADFTLANKAGQACFLRFDIKFIRGASSLLTCIRTQGKGHLKIITGRVIVESRGA